MTWIISTWRREKAAVLAVCRAFSSTLITAHRQRWKAVLKWRRRCVVFSLSFDYIPNYGASKQLNAAWMLWTDPAVELSCLSSCTAQFEIYLWVCLTENRLIFFSLLPFFREAEKPALITRVSSIAMTSSFVARMIPWCPWFELRCVRPVWAHTWGTEKAFLWERSFSLT